MSRTLRLLLLLAVTVGVAAFWVTGSLDNLVERAITEYGSAMTKARVSVDAVKIASASGKGTIGMLVVGNPAGFRTAHAFKAETIDVDIDLASLATDVVVIRLVTINGPDVIYEHGATNTNFDAIQSNIAAHLQAMRRKNDDEGIKLIIEELTICNATAQASATFMGGKVLSIPLPDITLRNIGKERGGITPGELGREVTGALMAKLSGAGSIERLKNSTAQALDQ